MSQSPSSRDTPAPAPVWRRKLLFAALYFSEGAPIGFIWVTIPGLLRSENVPVEKIAWLASVLILPWTLKFLWAPLVDSLRSERWGFRQWIYASQTIMGLSLVPLLWIDFVADFRLMAALLLAHGIAAATQDVAVDALCISSTTPKERGAFNGWMQVGVLLGRATMGGGALAIYGVLGQSRAISLLIVATFCSMALLIGTELPKRERRLRRPSLPALLGTYWLTFTQRSTWWGVAFALIAGAAFKSFEALYSVYLVDRRISLPTIGLFTAGPMIGALVIGSLTGGWLADRAGPFKSVGAALIAIVSIVATLAVYDIVALQEQQIVLFGLLVSIGFGIGVFTAASYALYMNITIPYIAATQFSTFMGAINGCESWSTYVLGQIAAARSFGAGMLVMCAVSLLALPLLWKMSHQLKAGNNFKQDLE